MDASAARQDSLATARWIAEDLVGFGSVRLGLPGFSALVMVVNPMVEVVPRIRRDQCVGRLPMLPYTAMTFCGIIWFVYGVLQEIMSVVIINTVQTVLGAYYFWVFWRFCPGTADWLPWTLKAHLRALLAAPLLCLAAVAASPRRAPLVLGLAGNLAAVVMFAGPLAAVGTVIREQSTRTLPLGFTCAVAVNGGLWALYSAALLGDYMIFVPNFIGFLLGLAQLSLFLRYGVHGGGDAKAGPAAKSGDGEAGDEDTKVLVAETELAGSVLGRRAGDADDGI